MDTVRVNRIHYPVTVLGYGRRLGIWVQGCPLACKGCIARDTWDPAGGKDMAVGELVGLWRQAAADGADGVTVSGGEPLDQPAALAALLDGIAAVPTDKPADILVYTGYAEAELDVARSAAVRRADVLITGRYEAGAPTDLIWRGSANQRMLLRTGLARRRYTRHLTATAERAPMQVQVTGGRVWLIGVPGRGDLARLERRLRRAGLPVTSPSWRPT